MAKIACTHPGKIGDALYALPAIRWLCERHGCQADFYTSEYCRPMEPLMRQQSCISDFIVPPGYTPQRYDCGVQPWQMPVPDGYDMVYHLGFRMTPERRLADWISETVGGPKGLPVHYELPPCDTGLTRPYVVVAPRGQSDYSETFRQICAKCSIDVVQIGGRGEAISGYGIDRTGEDFVTTASIIKGAVAFFGLMSSQLVLANGFQLPKIVPHNHQWDMRHVEWTPGNIYLAGPTSGEMLRCAGLGLSYSKCLEMDDYSRTNDFEHLDSIRRLLDGIDHRYEHPHRRWEYGMALAALRSIDARTVLDVGGGGSLFAPAAAWINADVTIVDPGECAGWVKAQSDRIGKSMRYIREEFTWLSVADQFDAVTCLSVIEHVENDELFLINMASKVADGGLLCLTTDFHPSGVAQCDGHLRTYSWEGMERLRAILVECGFTDHGGEPQYDRFTSQVNGYTFASLMMRKPRLTGLTDPIHK